MKVLFLTNVPSPYRVDFFNELGKYCDLTVVFEKNFSSERDSSWKKFSFDNFKGVFLKGINVSSDKSFSVSVTEYLKKGLYDHIIVSNIATPTGMLAISFMKAQRISYWLEGDGGFSKSGKGIKESIKRFFIKGAKGYFSTSSAHDKYYETYGADPSLIYRYPFTSISSSDIVSRPLNKSEKAELKNKLGIKESTCLISVGQFIHRKGFDVLLESARGLSKDVGIYIVGGVPTDEYIAYKEKYSLNNVHFVSFMSKDALREWYDAADLFVLPTREDIWGLVINEAMAHGLPVITTDRCIAGLELVEDGLNGYIVPVNDPDILLKRITEAIQDEKSLRLMGNRSLQTAAHYTIENMVAVHLKLLNINKKEID